MVVRLLWLASLPALFGFASAAGAAAAAPAPVAAASAASAAPAPPASRAGPRRLSPAEAGRRVAPPGQLQPERPVTPQVSIPLKRKPRPDDPTPRRPARGPAPAASGHIDEGAAAAAAKR